MAKPKPRSEREIRAEIDKVKVRMTNGRLTKTALLMNQARLSALEWVLGAKDPFGEES